MTKDDIEDMRMEFPRRRRLFRCHDGMCGGADCARCHGDEAAQAYVEEHADNPGKEDAADE
jgi:hypothetical protein